MEKHASRSKESTEGKSSYDILANLNFLREPLFTANYLPLSMLGSSICICICICILHMHMHIAARVGITVIPTLAAILHTFHKLFAFSVPAL